MIRPTSRSLLLLAAALPLGALPTLARAPGLWPVWFTAVAALVVAWIVEWSAQIRPCAVAIAIEPPPQVQFGDAAAIEVVAAASRPVTIDLRLDVDGPCDHPPDVRLRVVPGRELRVAVPLRPTRRGTIRVRRSFARWTGPLGLLWCETVVRGGGDVPVVTNVQGVRQRALQMANRREFQSGLKIERYVGDGSEFDSLRSFVVGMDRRAIDWKATARHRAVLCREFRAERDHAVMLCVDTGRLMSEPLDGMPRLDRAIHAALHLGYTCLRTGDRVGMFSFADAPQDLVQPQAGVHALQAIQARMAAFEYSPVESNFTRAMTHLLQSLRRRTLVVLFTDFVDNVGAELMLQNVHLLARRHLLLFVAMRDPLVDALASREPDSVDDVHRTVVADEIGRERRLVLQRLRRAGAQILDAEARHLESDLIARYLRVKRLEML